MKGSYTRHVCWSCSSFLSSIFRRNQWKQVQAWVRWVPFPLLGVHHRGFSEVGDSWSHVSTAGRSDFLGFLDEDMVSKVDEGYVEIGIWGVGAVFTFCCLSGLMSFIVLAFQTRAAAMNRLGEARSTCWRVPIAAILAHIYLWLAAACLIAMMVLYDSNGFAWVTYILGGGLLFGLAIFYLITCQGRNHWYSKDMFDNIKTDFSQNTIVFEGKVLGSGPCVCSWPGKYESAWDALVEFSRNGSMSAARGFSAGRHKRVRAPWSNTTGTLVGRRVLVCPTLWWEKTLGMQVVVSLGGQHWAGCAARGWTDGVLLREEGGPGKGPKFRHGWPGAHATRIHLEEEKGIWRVCGVSGCNGIWPWETFQSEAWRFFFAIFTGMGPFVLCMAAGGGSQIPGGFRRIRQFPKSRSGMAGEERICIHSCGDRCCEMDPRCFRPSPKVMGVLHCSTQTAWPQIDEKPSLQFQRLTVFFRGLRENHRCFLL